MKAYCGFIQAHNPKGFTEDTKLELEQDIDDEGGEEAPWPTRVFIVRRLTFSFLFWASYSCLCQAS